MGRRDAVQTMLEVVAECRRLLPGLIVTWEPGWETRGNGTSANYSYGSIHHTASVSSAARPFPTQNLLRNGRSDLPGPLCNVATPWCTVESPRLHVVAAHPANHGGASRASGPIPKLALFNPTSIGNEIDYAGSTPMSGGQLLVGHVFTRAVANVLAGGNVEVVRAHFETSVTGKWDVGYAPGKSYDMAAWRRQAAAITPPVPPAPASQQKENDLMFVNLEPGQHLTFPRPAGGDVAIKLAFDNNGIPGLDDGEQRARVGVHSIAGNWRAIFPGDKSDALAFWIPQGETRGFVMTPFEDIAVVKNLHSKLNLGVTITHTL